MFVSTKFQSILSFLAATAKNPLVIKEVANVISQEEWEDRMLSKESMKALGLKGSPKLSRVLLSAGVNQQTMEMALSGAKNPTKALNSAPTTYVVGHFSPESRKWLYDQGNSIHYSSCQANNPKAAWSGGGGYLRIDQELKTWNEGDLLMWVCGEPMFKGGDGFTARAKLRVVYSDRNYRQVAGLYIDRPYGQYNILLSELDHLRTWWEEYSRTKTPLYIAPVWQRENGGGSDFERMYGGNSKPLYCPSSKEGYQDTMTRREGPYTFLFEVRKNPESLLVHAYQSRDYVWGVYTTPLSDVRYNAQSNRMVVKHLSERTARKSIYVKALTQGYGLARRHGFQVLSVTWEVSHFSNTGLEGCYRLHLQGQDITVGVTIDTADDGEQFISRCGFMDDDLFIMASNFEADGDHSVNVYTDYPSLGFFKPIRITQGRRRKTDVWEPEPGYYNEFSQYQTISQEDFEFDWGLMIETTEPEPPDDD